MNDMTGYEQQVLKLGVDPKSCLPKGLSHKKGVGEGKGAAMNCFINIRQCGAQRGYEQVYPRKLSPGEHNAGH